MEIKNVMNRVMVFEVSDIKFEDLIEMSRLIMIQIFENICNGQTIKLSFEFIVSKNTNNGFLIDVKEFRMIIDDNFSTEIMKIFDNITSHLITCDYRSFNLIVFFENENIPLDFMNNLIDASKKISNVIYANDTVKSVIAEHFPENEIDENFEKEVER